MRVLVCGGRNFSDIQGLFKVLDEIRPDTIVHGNARGADKIAGLWARRNKKLELSFSANWKAYGRAAGYIRNKQMLQRGKPDMVIAFPGGKGTANMVNIAKKAGVKVKIIE